MRIVLVNPPLPKIVYSSYSSFAPILPPIGLLYLGAVLRERGDKVSLIDCSAERIDVTRCVDIIAKMRPDIVCATASSSTIRIVSELFSHVKALDKKLITIIGGPHISILPKETMKIFKQIDIGCIGEGEVTIKCLIDKIESKSTLKEVQGIVYREGNLVKINSPRENIKNLNSLPMPDFKLLKDIKLYNHQSQRARGVCFPLVTSRGCVYSCKFCDQGVFSRKWRAIGPEKITAMIKKLVFVYNVEFISFEDDNFGIDNIRVVNLCKMIVKNRIKIEWGCLIHLRDIKSEEMLAWMKKAGCWMIYVGIESGSQRMLDRIKKKITLSEIKKKVGMISKHGIKVYGSFILGLPEETKEEVEQTLALSRQLPLAGVSFHIYTPYPNTAFYNELPKKYKKRKLWDYLSGHTSNPVLINKNFTKEYLLKKQKEGYTKFFLRVNYIVKNLDRFLDTVFLKSSYGFFRELIK